jgi:hypothetical protein
VLAEQWAPHDLKVLGRKLLEAIDPEVAGAHEAKKLTEQERRAHEATSLRFHRVGDGVTRIVANLPDQVANRLATYLDAFTSPRHGDQTQGGSEPPVSSTESRGPAHVQRGHAFAALLEHLDPDQLPAHGGTRPRSSSPSASRSCVLGLPPARSSATTSTGSAPPKPAGSRATPT